MTQTNDAQQGVEGNRWAPGEYFGLQIPADPETLVAAGAEWLTQAFRASGSLAADNSVVRIVSAQGFDAGGTGKKQLVSVEYQTPQPGLPSELFVKYSRNFDSELWDSARHLMDAEVKFALLSRSDFPVPVAATLFADVESESGTGLIVSECIPYGEGNVEPRYFKCMDYVVPDQVDHYKSILRGLATLSGTYRAGKMSPDFDQLSTFDSERAPKSFNGHLDDATVLRRANRMFDFIERYPQLFPERLHAPEFREQFMRDIPDVLAAGDRITKILNGNPDFIAFAHWNANIDNCWFERQPDGSRRAGFIDWANAGQLSVVQSITGAISGAEPFVWDDHLDELLQVFIEEYAAHGGPSLDIEEVRLHILLGTAASFSHSMGAPIALSREHDDLDALTSHEDQWFVEHENARIQLHVATRMLSVWHKEKIGDVVRAL